MSESALRQRLRTLFRSVSLLSMVWGIVLGFYIVYVSLFGGSPFPFIDGLWWAGFGVLMVLQSIWYLFSVA